MKFLMNHLDPDAPDYASRIVIPFGENRYLYALREQAWQIIAVPKATEFYSVAELQRMGYVGVCEPESQPAPEVQP